MNILFASKICPIAIQEMSVHHNVVCAWDDSSALKEQIQSAEILVFRSGVQITAELIESAPDLRVLIRAGSGLDNLDLAYVEKHGIELYRIPEPGSRAVAELAIGLMLTLARRIVFADKQLRQGHWQKNHIEGYLLKDKTLGIVGAGNIGTALGELANGLGMNVKACVAHPSRERAHLMSKKGIQLTEFDSVLEEADFLSLNVPLLDSTRYLLGANELKRMKSGSYLVNLARGGVVDEGALFRALTTPNGLAGAALDVHEVEGDGKVSPLAELENVVLTPHIGATTVDTQREIGLRILALVASTGSPFQAKIGPGRCDDGYQIKTA